jgi:hypothetical protein
MKNFIGIYDNIMCEKSCNDIISFFEKNPDKHEGKLHKIDKTINVDKEAKDSLDLYCNLNNPTFNDVVEALDSTTKQYIKDFPECNNAMSPWCLDSDFNIQRYLPNQGYFSAHCESGSLTTNHRVLAWMIYLNNIDDGGETRWISYDLNIKPKIGRVVIWPAFFTHIHHGITSKTETKYIATGWYSYQ